MRKVIPIILLAALFSACASDKSQDLAKPQEQEVKKENNVIVSRSKRNLTDAQRIKIGREAFEFSKTNKCYEIRNDQKPDQEGFYLDSVWHKEGCVDVFTIIANPEATDYGLIEKADELARVNGELFILSIIKSPGPIKGFEVQEKPIIKM